VAAVILIGAGAWWFLVARASQEKGLEFSGTVETREIEVGSKVGGRVTEVLVEEGQFVKAGTPLVRFDAAELLAQQAQLEAGVAQMEAQLARLTAGFRPEEIAQADATAKASLANLEMLRNGARPQEVSQAKADLDTVLADATNAEANFRRVEKLYQTGDMSRQALDEARSKRDQAAGRTEAARQRLELLQAGSRAEDIRSAEERYRQAKAAADMTRRGYRKEDIAEARAKLAAAKGQLEEVKVRLREMEVRASADSRVEVVSVRPGDLVPAGRSIVTLLESTQLWVRIFVPEPELGRIAVGQKAAVTIDTYPGRQFDGYIEQISSRAEFLPRNIQTRDDRNHQVFGVKVRLDNSSGALKPGMAATVLLAKKD
jgi:multidrug resistance efflux pump